MSAREKIEGLTNTWYGYAVFGAALSLWHKGLGIGSLLSVGASFLFTIFLTWFIGKRLLAKSSLTRVILLITTSLSSVFGTIGVAKMGWQFVTSLDFSSLAYAAILGVSVYMNARSFRVLTDKSVKAYFG
jgi:hypothetical protein